MIRLIRPLMSATAEAAGGATAPATPPAAGANSPAPVGASAPPVVSAPVVPKPAPIVVTVPPLAGRLRALFSPAAAVQQLTEAQSPLQVRVTELEGQLATAQQQVAALTPKAAEYDRLAAEITRLEGEQKTVGEQAGKMAAETVASLGFPAGQLPPEGAQASAPADLAAQWNKLSGAERTEFFRKHEAALMAYANSAKN